MKKKSVRFSCLLLTLIFISCGREVKKDGIFRNDAGLLVKRFYYPDSITLKQEETIREQDSVLDGHVQTFYSSGAKAIYVEFVNGKKHGVYRKYYKNGERQTEGFNKQGLQDSLYFWYDSLGRLELKENFEKDVLCGEQIFYYANEQIKKCVLLNRLGEVMYEVSYDSVGKIMSTWGSREPLLRVFANHDMEKWKKGEVFRCKIYFCRCNEKNDAYVELVDSKGMVIDKKLVPLGQSELFYSFPLLTPGNFELRIIQTTVPQLTNQLTLEVR